VGPPGACIAAGAIRELVWNVLTGRPTGAPSADLDVIYFDSTEASDCSAKYESRLTPNAYFERVSDKDWARRWPELKIEPVRGAAQQGVSDGPETARFN
jgi:hypothetical protein